MKRQKYSEKKEERNGKRRIERENELTKEVTYGALVERKIGRASIALTESEWISISTR